MNQKRKQDYVIFNHFNILENALFGNNYSRNYGSDFKELNPSLNQLSGKSDTQVKKFKPGEIYSAYDLTHKQHGHYTRHPFASEPIPRSDIYELNKIDPAFEFKNVQLITKYLSPTGKILNHKLNGLCNKSQAKITKCIKRARALGVIPYLNRPNLLANFSE